LFLLYNFFFNPPPPPRKTFKINATCVDFKDIYYNKFVGKARKSLSLLMYGNFSLDGKKILSKQKFSCVYTKKYFCLYENLLASLQKFNRLNYDCNKIQMMNMFFLNHNNRINQPKIKVQTKYKHHKIVIK
jgi:hypothetical protein